MRLPKRSPSSSLPCRREFLSTAGLLAAGAMAGELALARGVHAAGSDVLKIGLIGCGGRGSGAAANALTADKNTRLVAMADAFADRLQTSLQTVQKKFPTQVAVKPERCFVGFDAYRQLIDSGVDVVLLATPPHFRPLHLQAAIAAGKHVFCEKPVAVDAPGVRSVLATCAEAARKGLSVVSGLCWRYHTSVRETMRRIHDGAIGDVLSIQETYLTGSLWYRIPPTQPPLWTEMETQMRNWYYFTWLCGDHNVEQHVHSLDKAAWVMNDQPPERAWGLGGRQVRTEAKFGDIYDHHAVVYEYANGTRLYSYCRQQPGCFGDVSDLFVGTRGKARVGEIRKHAAQGAPEWRYDGPSCNMYEEEHKALFGAIRSGVPINNGQYMARSTMLAILGRMVDYSGKAITWEDAINSRVSLSPVKYAWDAEPPTLPDKDGRYRVAMPGVK
jgi:predicted dehydrogenase